MKVTKLSQIFLIVPGLLLISTNVSDSIVSRKYGKKEDIEGQGLPVAQPNFR